MAYYADLTPCWYFRADKELLENPAYLQVKRVLEDTSYLRAVGWLEAAHPFATGACDPAVVQRLTELVQKLHEAWDWNPLRFRGLHTCSMCEAARIQTTREEHMGFLNLFIPGDGYVFAAPELILHYIAEHQYLPPQAFCDAVLACPEIGSEAYQSAILQYGSPELKQRMQGLTEERKR